VPGRPGIVQLAPVQWLQPLPPPGVAATIARSLRRRYGAARAQAMARQTVAEIRAHRLTTLAPGAVAERVHGAWLLVQFGSLAQRLDFLKTLHIAKLDLSPAR
jgi:hypothetical protein